MGKTGFQKFSEKAFVETHLPPIATPGEDVRRGRDERQGSGENGSATAGESSSGGRRGRPRGSRANLVSMCIRIDAGLKEELNALQARLHRSSAKDLIVEALTDLIRKYEL